MIFLTKARLRAEVERIVQEREYEQAVRSRRRFQIARVGYGLGKPEIEVREDDGYHPFTGTTYSSVIQDTLPGILTRILRAIEASGIEIRIVTHGPDTIEFHKRDSA